MRNGVAAAAVLPVLMLVTADGGPGALVPHARPQERRALAAFRAWVDHRTTARLTASFHLSGTFDSRPISSDQSSNGVLDFRTRSGRFAGASTGVGTDGRTTKQPVDIILLGRLQYTPGPALGSSSGAKRWLATDNTQWNTWTDHEKDLTYVRDKGPALLGGTPTHRFEGLIDTLRKRTIFAMPEPKPGCFPSMLAIDLYIDDRTGRLVRYDRRMVYPKAKDEGSWKALTVANLDSFTDFGVSASPPAAPSPDRVVQMPKSKTWDQKAIITVRVKTRC